MRDRPRFLSLSVSPSRILGHFLPRFPNRRALYGHVVRTLLAYPALGALVFLIWVVCTQGYDPINVVIGVLVGMVLGLVNGSVAAVPASHIPTVPFLILALLLSILATGSFELAGVLGQRWEHAGLVMVAVHLLAVTVATVLVARRYPPRA